MGVCTEVPDLLWMVASLFCALALNDVPEKIITKAETKNKYLIENSGKTLKEEVSQRRKNVG